MDIRRHKRQLCQIRRAIGRHARSQSVGNTWRQTNQEAIFNRAFGKTRGPSQMLHDATENIGQQTRFGN
jgi:hypothetical protein